MAQTQAQVKQRLTMAIKRIQHGMVSRNYENKAREYLLQVYDDLQSLRKDMDDGRN